MRGRRLMPLVLVFGLAGCAAVFRSGKPMVRVDADPPGARVRVADGEPQPVPADLQVSRHQATSIVVSKTGYAEQQALIRKRMNGFWVTWDILTCVIPVGLCIPLLIDAITGAWFDVERYRFVRLEPEAGPTAARGAASGSAAAAPTSPPGAGSALPESERKAAARAAFLEGVELQDKGDCDKAITRFESAQKLYDAPTHLLHIGECHIRLGHLIEAQESYETLSRASLSPSAPEVFRLAQETARRDLPGLKTRIPILRIEIGGVSTATLRTLVVTMNGARIPNELIGFGRPVNPGRYKMTAAAPGYKPWTAEVELSEGDSRKVDIVLMR